MEREIRTAPAAPLTVAAAPAAQPERQEQERPSVDRIALVRIGLLCAAGLAVGSGVWEGFGYPRLAGLAIMGIGGYPIFKEAVEHVAERRMTMELSMTVALVAALVIGEVFTALLIMVFVLVAEILEGLTVSRGRRAIGQLLDCLPRHASIRRNGTLVDVALDHLQPGDHVMIRPGGRIPVDGFVLGGQSFVDQSSITGESMPVERKQGDRVFAGTINQSGSLDVLTEHVGRDTSFGRIIEAVEHAVKRRAPVQRTADRLAGYLIYIALFSAAATFVWTRDARATISVIIVAGACGVAAGTPLALLGAIGSAARNGAIVKGGAYLEALWRIDTVVLDKTGTLTDGAVKVRAVYPAARLTVRDVVEVAAFAEARSEHPIGRAIVAHALKMGIPPEVEPVGFSAVPGRGVRASLRGEEVLVGNSHLVTGGRLQLPLDNATTSTNVFVMRGGEYLGAISVADAPRAEARRAIDGLRALGLRTYIFTGDARPATEQIARELGVDDFETGLLPEDKLRRVEALAKTRQVAMIGDGVNDAAALVASMVGVAMGSGTDVAIESADVVLIGNDLLKFVDLVRLAKRTRRIIATNFVGTLIVDGVGMALAAAGVLTPLIAALIHVISELAFILNAARLVPPRAAPGPNNL